MKPILDETRRREICAILAVGGTRTIAASYVGCHVETIRNTAKRDAQFAEQLRRAEISPEISYLRTVQTAAQDSKHWRAAAWALERLFPDRYASRNPKAITINQMTEILAALGAIVTDEVPVRRYRHRILDRLARLMAELPIIALPPDSLSSVAVPHEISAATGAVAEAEQPDLEFEGDADES